MSKIEKIKRVILIAVGFALATYLMMSGFAMLKQENSPTSVEGLSSLVEGNASSKVHCDAVK
mgnify:CR=1 FL=1